MVKPAERTDHTPAVAVTVVRTGGIAGIARRWHVEAPPADADFWVALVERCPWEQCRVDAAPQPGADRFMWEVAAARGAHERRAELAEQQVSGPWRDLIDAVREATPAGSGQRSPAPREP